MQPVYLTRCQNYTAPHLQETINQLCEKLFFDTPHFHGKKVLLKPNLITARAPEFSCTNKDFILSVARWFKEKGASLKIGDSPAFGTTKGVLRARGLLSECQRLGVEPIEFKQTRPVSLQDGTLIKVAAEAFTTDYLVNLPKIKAHNQMYVTLAAKNLYGLVPGPRKAILHVSHGADRSQFSRMLLNLIGELPPVISLVDGITVMHKAGPISGEPLSLGCIAAGKDPLELDAALMTILGLQINKSPLLREVLQQGHSELDTSRYNFPMLEPEQLRTDSFIPPSELRPITFHPLKLMMSRIKRLVMTKTA